MPGAGSGTGGGSGGGGFGTDAVNAIMKHMGDPDGSNPTCIWIFAGYKKGNFSIMLLDSIFFPDFVCENYQNRAHTNFLPLKGNHAQQFW